MLKSFFKIVLGLLAISLVIGLIAQWYKAAPMEPVAFTTSPAQAPLETNNELSAIEVIDLKGGVGPEDVALGPDGNLYAAMLNGDILKISADHSQITPLINTGGRPLGVTFNGEGNLIIADPYKGLLRVSLDKQEGPQIEVLI